MTVLDQNNGNMKNLNYKAGINITLKQHVVVLPTFTTLDRFSLKTKGARERSHIS